ncbi:hypothetical protein [uncultured Aquabacterium sp.]|uniref:hypothetical protein n=1 Tax=uncultured Aquabacterium sp. TaxID=158753 RepID=UPI0030CBA0A3|tara:strand:+ start:451 stop:630 length:180 start_codon:yes stop_codon:yes gene_type:complete
MKHRTPALFALLLCSPLALPAWAHEGHGLSGTSHWHGTDVLGFVGAIAVATAIWLKGRK